MKLYFTQLIFLQALLLPAGVSAQLPFDLVEEPAVIRIGVLAPRGKERAIERWTPTADYLTDRIDDYQFEIVPADLDELTEIIRDGHIQFVLTNPGNYVFLESRFGASRIATKQTRELNQTLVRYGAVIITRANNHAIRKLEDLKGKTFMAVSKHAMGGFQMAWRESRNYT